MRANWNSLVLPSFTLFVRCFPERNLNPKAACLKRREEEKTEELPGHHMVHTPNAADLAQNTVIMTSLVAFPVATSCDVEYFVRSI